MDGARNDKVVTVSHLTFLSLSLSSLDIYSKTYACSLRPCSSEEEDIDECKRGVFKASYGFSWLRRWESWPMGKKHRRLLLLLPLLLLAIYIEWRVINSMWSCEYAWMTHHMPTNVFWSWLGSLTAMLSMHCNYVRVQFHPPLVF